MRHLPEVMPMNDSMGALPPAEQVLELQRLIGNTETLLGRLRKRLRELEQVPA